MSKTKLWSLQFSCRRLAREARSLSRNMDASGDAGREIEQHLIAAAQRISASMEQVADPTAKGEHALDVAQLAFGDNAWASRSPLGDYKAAPESPPSPQHRLGLRAGAQFVATPDLITFLCSLKKCGVLLVDTIDERFTVELEQGDIVHAHSDGAPEGERLGDVLIENGVLQREALDAVLAEGIRGRLGGRLGARLLERGLATPDQLLAALETQIRRLFHRLFTAEATDIVFWEGPCLWGEQSMRLNATMLLLDGARAIDESQRLESDAAAAADGPDGTDGTDADRTAVGEALAEASWLLSGEGAAVPAEPITGPAHIEHPLSPTPGHVAAAGAAVTAQAAEPPGGSGAVPAPDSAPAAAPSPAATEPIAGERDGVAQGPVAQDSLPPASPSV